MAHIKTTLGAVCLPVAVSIQTLGNILLAKGGLMEHRELANFKTQSAPSPATRVTSSGWFWPREPSQSSWSPSCGTCSFLWPSPPAQLHVAPLRLIPQLRTRKTSALLSSWCRTTRINSLSCCFLIHIGECKRKSYSHTRRYKQSIN